MDVIAITRQLGKAIQEDERYQSYMQAKTENDADSDLQNAIGAFNLLRMQLNEELAKEDKSEEKVKELNGQLRKSYAEVMVNPTMQAYNAAKGGLDELVNQINGIISLCVNGEDPDTCEPSNCGGSCSSCSGCH